MTTHTTVSEEVVFLIRFEVKIFLPHGCPRTHIINYVGESFGSFSLAGNVNYQQVEDTSVQVAPTSTRRPNYLRRPL